MLCADACGLPPCDRGCVHAPTRREEESTIGGLQSEHTETHELILIGISQVAAALNGRPWTGMPPCAWKGLGGDVTWWTAKRSKANTPIPRIRGGLERRLFLGTTVLQAKTQPSGETHWESLAG